MKFLKESVILIIGVCLFCAITNAQAATTRPVNVSWTISNQAGVTGYNLYVATTSGGPYQKLNTSPIAVATPVFNDTGTVGQVRFYAVTAIAAPCTQSTPITTPCGESDKSPEFAIPVPPRPQSSTVVFVANIP